MSHSGFTFDLPTNELVARRLRYLIQTEYGGSYERFHEQVKGKITSDAELRLFKRFIDFGNMSDDFYRILAEKTKIGQVTFSRFFDLHVDNAELFGD